MKSAAPVYTFGGDWPDCFMFFPDFRPLLDFILRFGTGSEGCASFVNMRSCSCLLS